MRALRVVGFDGEGDKGVVILEDLDRRERFTVPADERLRAAARGDVLRLGQMSMDLESQLRPREIQARIRAGASVEQVAEAAGVPLQRIERFAYPVLLERSRMSELAQHAHPVREDGPDVRTLGEVVSHTFGLRGQEYDQAEWDSWRGEDNKWVVALRWSVGHSDITARWGYHPGAHGGTVSALDEHATDLIDGQLSRPPRRVGPVIDFSKPDVADEFPEVSARTATDDRPAPEARQEPVKTQARTTAEPRLEPARSRMEPARSRPEAPAAQARPEPRPEPEGSAEARPEPEGSAEARPQPRPEGSQQAADEAPAAEPVTRPSAGAKRSSRKAKPVMPSWEDVLLGVKTQR